MRLSLSKLYFFLLVVASLSFVTACNDSTFIGSDLIDDSEFYGSYTTDTLTLTTNSFKADSIITSNVLSNGSHITYLLGGLDDPTFGSSKASIYGQLSLPNSSLNLGSNLQLDSVVLTLQYTPNTTPYGDTLNNKVDVNIYEMAESMSYGKPYFANQTFAYYPTLLGRNAQTTFAAADSVTIQKYGTKIDTINNVPTQVDDITTETLAPQMRIRLSNELGYRLLAQSGTNNFKDNASFRDFFKGLYITTNTDAKVVASISPFGSQSGITLYYSNSLGKGKSTDFVFNGAWVVNSFENNHTNTEVGNALTQTTPTEQEYVYVQGMSGVGFTLNMPYLSSLGNAAINRAELELTVKPDSYSLFTPPNKIDILSVLNNRQYGGLKLTDATKQTTSDGFVKYKLIFATAGVAAGFPVSIQYLQDKLMGEYTDRNDRLLINFLQETPSRAIICGPNHPEHPMKLNLIYTPITE
jgi:hypothetical protein